MIRVIVDKIASSTKNVRLAREVRITEEITAAEGYLVAGRIHGEKSVYNTLENCDGRMVTLHDGDVVVGVLGQRNALHGYSGVVPERIAPGDRLHVLNLGGVIGKCTSVNPEVGRPFEFEVLGTVLVFPEFESRQGVPAHIGMNALRASTPLASAPKVPIIFVAGTCMNAGKTLASCQITRRLLRNGMSVAACKLTGVALLKDVLQMRDYGAKISASFLDAGIVSTTRRTAAGGAHAVLSHLSETGCDVIIAELGDGLLGQYGVDVILADEEIMKRCSVLVLCANDPVGAWGGVELLKEQYKLTADVITGPTTDNDAGALFVREKLQVPALNARTHGEQLGDLVSELIGKAAGAKA